MTHPYRDGLPISLTPRIEILTPEKVREERDKRTLTYLEAHVIPDINSKLVAGTDISPDGLIQAEVIMNCTYPLSSEHKAMLEDLLDEAGWEIDFVKPSSGSYITLKICQKDS